ncbi:MAG: branched-chain amino acid ABC transporter permease [Candidatus Eremiobacteraeota bacterium]|nr:branched-chain amino acid ABC transporter permease [Candidatus Eremiobacteraeota bacterium]
MALGITFIYSIVRLINWAMGAFYMVGSYLQFILVTQVFGVDRWWLAVPCSVALVFVLGALLEPILIRPMFAGNVERKDEYATVVTIALLLFMTAVASGISGPYQRTPGSNLGTIVLGPLPVSGARFAALVVALVALGLFYLFIKRTWLGMALRAAADSRTGVQIAGVDLARIDQFAFGGGVALAALAGALLAPVFLVFPTNGAMTTTKGFEIIIIGGLGSIPGALAGGLLLGVVESLGTVLIAPQYQNAYGFLLVLLILLVRPVGLFGKRLREV